MNAKPTKVLGSAPGKLFLLGEYAVLAGGWSLVCAVDRYVHILGHDGDPPGYRVEGADFAASDSLPRAVLRHAGVDQTRLDSLLADVHELYHRGEKLGLGSSAASTAALLEALAGECSPAERFATAFTAHREIQRGRGSGGDIAAACFRGLLAYKLVEPQEPFPLLELNNTRGDVVADVARIAEMSSPGGAPLPPGVRIEAVWTGAPASSTQLIGRVELALAKDPERVRDALERIAACAEDGIRALESNNSADFIRVIDEAGEAMDALGLLCEAPIVTALHRKLARSVRAAGAACKPSGAGGGDFSLIVGASDLDWGAILGDLPEGCEHIALRIVSKG